ncbi:TetR/AcrR family transcriptional regulator C-terminal domain-containing protein [Demequina sp.]|uniref:TetR/AcrR family transcriptional regulator C-terminal domain-containing protein n=1 Tax=Demequina sp. TaxID=2050685 RepID=UPI003D0BB0C3
MSRDGAPLSPEQVIARAIALADAEGLEALTMRRLASDLGVTPMALYNHVPNREGLLDAMVEHIVATFPPVQPGGDWQDALRARLLSARSATESHAWFRDAIQTRTLAGPHVLGYMDSLMHIMFDGGLSADLVHHAMHTLSTRMWGFTRDVLPTPAVPDDPVAREEMYRQAAIAFPNIIRMATTAPGAGQDCDDRAEFEFAIDVMIDGFARRHASQWSSLEQGY